MNKLRYSKDNVKMIPVVLLTAFSVFSLLITSGIVKFTGYSLTQSNFTLYPLRVIIGLIVNLGFLMIILVINKGIKSYIKGILDNADRNPYNLYASFSDQGYLKATYTLIFIGIMVSLLSIVFADLIVVYFFFVNIGILTLLFVASSIYNLEKRIKTIKASIK